jgi:hypothetical protein
MKFKEAVELLKQGFDIKRPHWSGFWRYEDNSIKMYCKDGKILDIRETEDIFYTLEGILADDWEVANIENSKLLAGETTTTFSFGEAVRNLKNGYRVARKGWSSQDKHLFYASGADYYMLKNTELLCGMDKMGWIGIVIEGKRFGPWSASQDDILANDWYIVNGNRRI